MKNISILFCILIFTACKNNKQVPSDPDIFYTCSMHPQVIRDKPGKCPICQMKLIAVNRKKISATNEIELSSEQVILGNIQTDTIKSGTLKSQSVFTGTVNFNEKNINTISARLPGRIDKLYFRNVGDFVPRGAPVYNLYSEELNSAQQEYILLLQQRKELGNAMINYSQLLESARKKLLLWGMSPAQVKEIERTHKTHPTTTFYSNTSGFIMSLDVLEGDYAMGGQSLMKLVNLSSVWVEAQVYTSELSQIDRSRPLVVRIPGLPQEIPGKIEFINPEVNQQSRINLLRVSIPNTGNQLKPGMAATIILKGTQQNSIMLPTDAIIKSRDMAMIWLSSGKNKFKSQMVTTGIENNGRTEITAGLKQGDIVVISGAYLLNSEYLLRTGNSSMQGDMGNMKM